MYVSTKTLPDFVQSALKAVDYHKTDIEVKHVETFTPSYSCGSAGRRGFTVLVNMDTQEHKINWGSWGGANMFNLDNPVDLDTSHYPMTPGMLVIQGSSGYPMTWATILAHKSSAILPLPSGDELPENLLKTLYCFKGYKAFYRKELIDRGTIKQADVDKLVEMGHLSRNKAGATQITTQGKNAVGDFRCYL